MATRLVSYTCTHDWLKKQRHFQEQIILPGVIFASMKGHELYLDS